MINQDTTRSRRSHSPLILRQPKKNAIKIDEKERERKIEGMTIKKLELMQSFHESVAFSSQNSSLKNVVNSTIFNNSEQGSIFSIHHNIENFQMHSSMFPIQNYEQKGREQKSLSKSGSLIKISKKKGKDGPSRSSTASLQKKNNSQMSTLKGTPDTNAHFITERGRQKTIESILKKYINTNFIQSLMQFINKDWEQQEKIFFKEKRFESLRVLITQKTNYVNQLIDDFMSLEVDKYDEIEKRIIMSLLFRESSKILKDYDNLFLDILKKIPEDKIVKQESEIQGLHAKILEIYDPKYINSSQKMKDRAELFMEGYTSQKNNLLASIANKLKPSLDFIIEIEKYLSIYQKQIIKIRNQLQSSEIQKTNISKLLSKKVSFTPIEFDYDRLKQMTDESKKEFFEDLDSNYIKFHKQLHKKSDRLVKRAEQQNQRLFQELEAEKQKNQKLEQEIYEMKNSLPKKTDFGAQVFLLNSLKNNNSTSLNSITSDFLQNVSTPFSFTEKITGSLINLLAIDKLLYDYQIIKNKYPFNSFSDFMVQWFVIRTGSKKIAQIFAKNFMYSIKQLKWKHKRFELFTKFCGFTGFRKRNIREDLEYIFFQTHRAWYLLIRIALKYRKKFSDNPSGYHIFPPLPCQEIFKVSLKQMGSIIKEIFEEQGIAMADIEKINDKSSLYAVNQVPKFKQHDIEFQKQPKQEVHILQHTNFDILVGFILERIAKQKCAVVESFLRALALKQKQTGNVLGFSEFETIYKKYFREKRSKIELIFSKMCLCNQNDILNIENLEPVIRAIIEDQSGLRSSFETNDTLRQLAISFKQSAKQDGKGGKYERKIPTGKSYESFREKYYFQFYDFYSTTAFLLQIYRVIKGLIKNKLKECIKDEKQLNEFLEDKQPHFMISGEEQKKENKQQSNESDSSDDEYEDDEINEKGDPKKYKQKQLKDLKPKFDLESKVEAWNKIVVRIPHFFKILTIDQLIVHNMRKEMIDASEFAWKILREILIIISKH